MTEVSNMTEHEINELLGDNGVGNSDELIDEEILNTDVSIEENKEETDSEKMLKEADAILAEVFNPQEDVKKEEEKAENSAEVTTSQEIVEVLVLDDDDCQIQAAQPSVSQTSASSQPRRRKREATYMKTRNMARQVVSQSIASFDGKPNEVILRSICKYAQKSLIDHKEEYDNMKKEISDLKKEKEMLMRELKGEKSARLAMMKKLEEAKEEMERLKIKCGSVETVDKPMIQPTNSQRIQHVNYNSNRPMTYPPVNTVISKMATSYNYHQNQKIRKRPCENYPEPRKNMRIESEILMAAPLRSQQIANVQAISQNDKNQEMSQVGRGFGHDLKITRQNPQDPYMIFEQDSEKSKDVCLFVPHVPMECLNRNSERPPPQMPMFFKNNGSVNISVTIRSSKQDFYDTWQLGGFVDYSKLTDYFDRNVQFYVQVHSMRPNGLCGVIPQITQTIEWGNSKPVKCGANGKTKFRVKFHKNQDLPHEDRLSIFAVAYKTDNSRIDVSPIASLTFT